MGILNSLWNITKWFTDKTGITSPKESLKRKNEECEITSNNKKIRTDVSLVEVVDIGDESLSEDEEAEIIEPGPSDVPLGANPNVILDGRLNQKQIISPMDQTESNDEENNIKIIGSSSLSNQPYLNRTASMNKITSNSFEDKCTTITSSIKGTRNLSLNMERRFSASKINDRSEEDSKNKILTQILKHYLFPKVETSIPISRSTLNKEHDLNQSYLPQTTNKENAVNPELSTNKIIKRELFYDRIFRKFRETQAAAALATPKVQNKSPDEIFIEKLEIMNKTLSKIKLPLKLIKNVFPDYSDNKIEFIKNQMKKPQNESIIKGFNVKIKDLKTLFIPQAWLNDEVINHYMGMIVEREPAYVHMFNTFFYVKLSVQGYKSVSRWTKKKDIFQCKKMFIPIHLGNHWCLIYVDFLGKTINYYDSLGGKNHKCLNTIFGYLREEYHAKKNKVFNCDGWSLLHASNCPPQKNGYDCGVFTCINAEYLARDAELDFTQQDIPKLRLRMCYEILKNKLCY